MEKLEDETVSLDFRYLDKRTDNVKLEYQKLFNSIRNTRSQTQTKMDGLIAHVSEKTYAYGAIRAENQNLLITISELKTRLANVEKDITSENVISNKENIIDVDVANAPKAKIFNFRLFLLIVDSGFSKHMTGDRSLLKNFIEKFMGTVHFGNDNFAAITGYGAEIMSNKFMTAQQEPVIMFEDDPQANQAGFKNSASEMANEGLGSSGWFDRLFGEKKEEVNVKTKVLESFDSLLWFE
ncbi:hypothetical protein Tco_0853890 [Tanacetum coccineum]